MPGAYTDPTGLLYLINRYYDPRTGQFLSADPDVSQTLQPYAYASDTPVMAADPTGLYAVLYEKTCGPDGCMNITKRCMKVTNHCGLYWAAKFFSDRGRHARDVRFNFKIEVNGWKVQGPQHYGHPTNGMKRWHGQWGFKTDTWGAYSVGPLSYNMGPDDRITLPPGGPYSVEEASALSWPRKVVYREEGTLGRQVLASGALTRQ